MKAKLVSIGNSKGIEYQRQYLNNAILRKNLI